MSEEEKKPEIGVIFPGTEVFGINIKPVSYGQFVSLIPWFEQVKERFKEKGITGEQLGKIVDDPQGSMDGIMDLLKFCLPILPELISKTTGKQADEIESWDFDKVVYISLVIIYQNVSRIKNLFGPVRQIRGLSETG
jgi:hypothetical protein